MVEWFTEQQAGMIGGIIGTCIGCWGGLIGCMSTFCVRKGLKKLIYALFGICIAAGFVLTIAGLVALFTKQPYHVWYAFLLPGGLAMVIPASLLPTMRKRFTEYEMRQIQARDL